MRGFWLRAMFNPGSAETRRFGCMSDLFHVRSKFAVANTNWRIAHDQVGIDKRRQVMSDRVHLARTGMADSESGFRCPLGVVRNGEHELADSAHDQVDTGCCNKR